MPRSRRKNVTRGRRPRVRAARRAPLRQPWHRRMGQRLYHAFVPHPGNDHRPHALRPRSLVSMAVTVIVIKVLVTGLLFTVYPSPGYFSSATVSRFLALTNSERSKAGVGTLKVSTKLTRAAEAKAQDILTQDYFAHTTPQGKKFWEWIKEQGYRYSTAGENLALDFSDADVAHRALMASPGHRANILNEKYTHIGLAVKSGTFEGRKTTVLVQLFAKPVKVRSRPIAAAEETPPAEPEAPAPAPVVQTSPAPPAPVVPTFRAEAPALNFSAITIASGDSAVLTAEFKNTGTVTWTREGPNAVVLQTAAPSGRASKLAAAGWPSASVAALLAPIEVPPGEVGRWIFSVDGPPETGVYAERFELGLSDGSIIPDSEVTFTVTVEPPALEPAPVPTAPVAAAGPPPGPAPDELTSEDLTPTGEVRETIAAAEAPAAEVSPSLATVVRGAVTTSNTLFLVLLAFLTVTLLVTVVVRWEVQHHHVVAGTILLIVLTAGLLVAGVHFLDLSPLAEPQVLSSSLP